MLHVLNVEDVKDAYSSSVYFGLLLLQPMTNVSMYVDTNNENYSHLSSWNEIKCIQMHIQVVCI